MLIGSFGFPEASVIWNPSHPELVEIALWPCFLLGICRVNGSEPLLSVARGPRRPAPQPRPSRGLGNRLV